MSRMADWGYGTVDLAQVKAAGLVGIARYLSLSPLKNITPDEARKARALGLDVCLVWETTATRSTEGASAGRADGSAAAQQAHSVGYPQGATIYAASDTDTTWEVVAPYQGQFNAAVARAGYHGDVYGGYRVVFGAVNARMSSEPWQTAAWSRDARGKLQVHPMAVLLQDNFHFPISGVDCDTSQVRGRVNGWAANDGTLPAPDSEDEDMKVLYTPNDPKRGKALLKGDGTLGVPANADDIQAYADAGIPLVPVPAKSYDALAGNS